MYSNNRDPIKTGVARKLKPTRRSVSGFYPIRNGNMIAYESMLERDFIARTNFSLYTLDIIPQPVSIPFIDNMGRKNTYTPDFLVYYRLNDRLSDNYPKPLLIEVKPREEWTLHWRTWLNKWKAAYRYAMEHGYTFHIRDESRIRDASLANIKFLCRYERMSFDEEDISKVIDDATNKGFVTFDYLLNRHFIGDEKAWGVSLIWHLLATRKLDCDVSLPLNNKTEFWIANHA